MRLEPLRQFVLNMRDQSTFASNMTSSSALKAHMVSSTTASCRLAQKILKLKLKLSHQSLCNSSIEFQLLRCLSVEILSTIQAQK